MAAYYNEIDPAAAHVLRALIADGVIAPGEVDERSIVNVQPDDLRGFDQCHFFAGGGLWSVAARGAGWADDRPLWTGSCPCQPFSVAGKGAGTDDPRHLWPDFFRLIRASRPPVVVGEQVAAAAGTDWLDGALSDLESDHYAARAVDLPACAVDAPHQRQRIYWVAIDDRECAGLERQRRDGHFSQRWACKARPTASPNDLTQPDTDGCGRNRRPEAPQRKEVDGAVVERPADKLLPDADFARELQSTRSVQTFRRRLMHGDEYAFTNESFWSDSEWIVSPIDGKARRAKPGICFLVDGLPGRVDLWRIGGNAIVPPLATQVLAALMETTK